jgi:uncharacterized membrane protein YphA (DoxX/SURF4 family)
LLVVFVAIFLILHGLIHLLYFGQSQRYLELQPDMVWPDGSWVLGRILETDSVRLAGSVALVLAALGLVIGGVVILIGQAWWRPLVIAAAMLSSAIFIVLWDGSLRRIDDQGGVAILINIAILVAMLVFNWPDFDF